MPTFQETKLELEISIISQKASMLFHKVDESKAWLFYSSITLMLPNPYRLKVTKFLREKLNT